MASKEFNLWGIKGSGKYRPCNGCEGDSFTEHFCERCQKDINQDCYIAARAMLFGENEKEYPEEWQYNENGNPTCTVFEEK